MSKNDDKLTHGDVLAESELVMGNEGFCTVDHSAKLPLVVFIRGFLRWFVRVQQNTNKTVSLKYNVQSGKTVWVMPGTIIKL